MEEQKFDEWAKEIRLTQEALHGSGAESAMRSSPDPSEVDVRSYTYWDESREIGILEVRHEHPNYLLQQVYAWRSDGRGIKQEEKRIGYGIKVLEKSFGKTGTFHLGQKIEEDFTIKYDGKNDAGQEYSGKISLEDFFTINKGGAFK